MIVSDVTLKRIANGFSDVRPVQFLEILASTYGPVPYGPGPLIILKNFLS